MAISAKVATAYVDLVARTADFEKGLNDARGQAQRFSKQMREETEVARGGMVLLGEEIGVHIPRHLQKFVAQLPGVTAAMNAAFTGVAIFAVGELVFKVGEKIVEFAKKNEEAARKTEQAWRGISGPMQLTNDQLQLENDKLAAAIAKMEHKPSNAMKTAIDEAIVSAETLGQKLDTDIAKIADVLKGQEINFFGELAGKAGTSDVTEHARDLQAALQNITVEESKALAPLREQHATQKQINDEVAKFNDKRRAAIQAEQGWQEKQLSTAQSIQDQYDKMSTLQGVLVRAGGLAPPEQKERIRSLQGFGAGLAQGGTFIDLSAMNSELTQEKTVGDAKTQAAQELLKRYQDTIDRRKALHGVDAGEELLFWRTRLTTFAANSDQYLKVLEKEADAEKRFAEEMNGAGKLAGLRKELKNAPTDVAPALVTPGRDANGETKDADAVGRYRIEQVKLHEEWALSQDRLKVLNGTLSEHQAALNATREHAQQYAVQLDVLREQLDRLKSAAPFAELLGSGGENRAQQLQVQSEIDATTTKQRIAAQADAVNELGTTWRGMVDSVFAEIVRRGQQTQEQIRQIALRMVDGLNTEIAKGLTGQKTNFQGVFRGGAESLAKAGLERLEGGLLGKMFSPGNPGHVLVDNLPQTPGAGPSLAGGGAGGLVSRGILGFLNDSTFFSGLAGGNLFGAGGFFGGGHALGGSVMAGVPIDVGELGPERFVPAVPGHIVPNSETRGGVVMHIDARGTDPALTRENFARALAQTHQLAVHDASRAMAEQARRRPH